LHQLTYDITRSLTKRGALRGALEMVCGATYQQSACH
jgi:hypothetical protein